MSDITINTHDLLGKMTIIKNCLSLVLENKNPPLDEKTINLLQTAGSANQDLIDRIKNLKTNG